MSRGRLRAALRFPEKREPGVPLFAAMTRLLGQRSPIIQALNIRASAQLLLASSAMGLSVAGTRSRDSRIR